MTLPNRIRSAAAVALAAGALSVLSAAPAYAYIGPGAGLTAFGTVLAVIAAIGLAILGFVWYPVKRLLGQGRTRAASPSEAGRGATAEE